MAPKQRVRDEGSPELHAAVRRMSSGEWTISVQECKGDSGACLYRSVAAALGEDYQKLRQEVVEAHVSIPPSELAERAFAWAMLARTQRTADFMQAKREFQRLADEGVLDATFLQLVSLHGVRTTGEGVELKGALDSGRQVTLHVSSRAVDEIRKVFRGLKAKRMGNADDMDVMSQLRKVGFVVFSSSPTNGSFLQGGSAGSFSRAYPAYVTLYNRENRHFKAAVLTRAGEAPGSGRSWFKADQLPGFVQEVLRRHQALAPGPAEPAPQRGPSAQRGAAMRARSRSRSRQPPRRQGGGRSESPEIVSIT